MRDQPIDNYNLEVNSLSGDNFTSVTRLDMNTKKNTVLVQTDKSIYKPADKVQFRVLVLNSDMRANTKKKVQVFISDGAQNRVKQFEAVTLNKGFFQNELQLSDSPVMGTWRIHVKLNGSDETTKDFEVAEYTLPKFEVKLDVNPDANYKDGKVRATVKAKYTFGKIAKGNATVTAEVTENRWWWKQEPSIKVSKSVEVDGKKPVEFDIESELGVKDKDRERTVKLFATFKEELTGRELNATATVTVHVTPHKIDLTKSSNNFKPGLPFSVTAYVKYHDQSAPVSDKTNPLKFTIKYYYDVLRTCQRNRYQYRRNYLYFGEDSFPITSEFPIESYECREEHSYDEVKEVFLTNGVSKVDIVIPSNTTRIDVAASYLETKVSLFNYISRLEAKSNQFLQIKSLTAK